MGKLILCSGKRTNRPYVFAATGSRIYSIEELCYYIESHIYFVDQEMFTDSLFDWIESELFLVERAEKLRLLKKQKADIRTILVAVLCSCDYYSETEIKRLIKVIEELCNLSPLKRRSLRAYSYIENRRYNEAELEYEQLLNSKEAAGMTPEEYGDILHNLAIAQIHSGGLAEASETFRQAFERNRREESLRQYLYTLHLSDRADLFMEKIEEYGIDKELKEDIILTMESLELQAAESSGIKELRGLEQLRAEGRLFEYRNRVQEVLEVWIAESRQI